MPVDFTETRPVTFDYHGIREAMLSDYVPTWDYQREVHARVASHEIGPQVIFVEHSPVYTAGRRTLPEERPFDGTPVVDVDRGGKITFHGPRQLVGYPIVYLKRGIGVVDYVRRVEEAIIRYLATLGITAGRVPGRAGVWVGADERGPERKICAIGIRVSRQTTLHGFALNLDPDLAWFDNIVPCGISDAGVTSVQRELGHSPSVVEAAEGLEPFLAEMLAFERFEQSPDVAVHDAAPASISYGITATRP